ncbi:MAG: DUF692 family protein [Deltaproteobacteria bacterium]|jgi:uncharacterized protein (UPF0276 family)|nr:DUF692 family protein [Deltaproteobacteria bacterium]
MTSLVFKRDSFAGLPVSHLFDRSNPLVHEILSLAEVLELKNPNPPAWLPPLARVFHWGYGICEDDFQENFLPVGNFLQETSPSLFSCDLGPAARKHEGILPISPIMGQKAIYERAKINLRLLRSKYDGPVALENYNFYPTGLYNRICDPDFIADFLSHFNLGLVLDLAHAAISAVNMGFDIFRYLEKLPLDKVVEIHVSKPYLPPEAGRLGVDTHEAPEEREWSWLSFVLDHTRLTEAKPLVLIEYYKDLKTLKKCMLRMQEKLNVDLSPSQNPIELLPKALSLQGALVNAKRG